MQAGQDCRDSHAASQRHLLMNGIPINYLSRWLGHSSIQTVKGRAKTCQWGGPDGESCRGALAFSSDQTTHQIGKMMID